jgi:hypothetical protein
VLKLYPTLDDAIASHSGGASGDDDAGAAGADVEAIEG